MIIQTAEIKGLKLSGRVAAKPLAVVIAAGAALTVLLLFSLPTPAFSGLLSAAGTDVETAAEALAVDARDGEGLTRAEEIKGTISLSGAWALYPLAVKWAEEFRKTHPGVRLDVQAGGAGKGIADALAGMVDIGMVSRDIHPEEAARGAYSLAVAKDAVVPTASRRNPYLKELRSKGVKKSVFEGIFISGRVKTWNDVLANGARAEVHAFTRSDACGAAETWAAYLDKKQEDLLGIAIYGDPGLADAVIRDPLAVGFNNINFAYDAGTLKPVEGLVVIPVDLNGNGILDPGEKFYGSRDEITAAIERGAYPSPPARELYFVTKGKPARPVVRQFIRWVLKEGQKFVREAGYIPLNAEKLNLQLSFF